MKQVLYSFMWLMPFIFFIAGYGAARWYFAVPPFAMPTLLGMDAHHALLTVSEHNLNPRIIAQKESNHCTPGTVLQQTPQPHTIIKQYQSVFLVLAKQPKVHNVPHFVGMHVSEIKKITTCTPLIHYLPHSWPHGTCFAQWPEKGSPLVRDKPVVYVSKGSEQPVIWPQCIGQNAHTVIEFLKNYDITPDIICHVSNADDTNYSDYTVTDQRPLAGSLVDITHPERVMVQLRIE